MVKVKRKNKRKPILHAVNYNSKVLTTDSIKLYGTIHINVLRDINGFVKGWHKDEFDLDKWIDNKDGSYTYIPDLMKYID
jgi:hypothetical protein